MSYPGSRSEHPRSDQVRDLLLSLFQAAVSRVEGRAATAQALQDWPGGEVALLAVGKAADAMARGAWSRLGDEIVEGLVVTKYDHGDPAYWADTGIEYMESAHPVPNAASLVAGQSVARFVQHLPPDLPLLCLISGGASALVELPRPGVDLALLQRASEWLLGSGLDIHAINRVRQGLSQLKGGGLLALAGDRPVTGLYISDVAGDDPAVIGSGLLGPAPVAALPSDLPDWLAAAIHEVPAATERTTPVERRIVASLAIAVDSVASTASTRGWPVHAHTAPLAGDAAEMGRAIANTLRRGPPGIYVWGGETTVALPPEPGRGGRNQQLALAAAEVLADVPGIWVLSAGTDGSDGPTEDAGALIDGSTLERASLHGFDAADCLARADAGSLLAASGDLINTGPTGTNVTDLVIACKAPGP